MKFVEYVPDYILRNYVKIGQKVTILKGSAVAVQVVGKDKRSLTLESDLPVTVTNFLPGYTEVYYPHDIHNHQVVWREEGEIYYSTDINNVKEVRDAE